MESLNKSINKISIKDFENELMCYLKKEEVEFDNKKIQIIFSCAKTPDKVLEVFYENINLFQNEKHKISEESLNIIFKNFYFVTKLYIHFIFMRSGALEKGLKQISDYNNLETFSEIMKDESIRHLRNSIAHATFEISQEKIYFNDRKFKANITIASLDKLMNLILSFFFELYKFDKKIPEKK